MNNNFNLSATRPANKREHAWWKIWKSNNDSEIMPMKPVSVKQDNSSYIIAGFS